jgi:hypothetical protein
LVLHPALSSYCAVNPPPLILFPAFSIVVASLFALLLSFVLVVDALVVIVVVVVVVVVVVGLKGDLRDSTPNCLLAYIPPFRCLLHLSSFVGSPASVFPVNVPPGSPKLNLNPSGSHQRTTGATTSIFMP